MRVPRWLVGEFLGTFLLVFFGCGCVAAAVTTGAQVGLFQVAIVWGIAIALAIFLTADLSGAHLNPAVTLAMAVFGGFPGRRVLPYIATQLVSAFVAAAVVYMIFAPAIQSYESEHQITRGAPGSEATAMIFGEYFPNPGGLPITPEARNSMPVLNAFFVETVGATILLIVIFGVTDPRNSQGPRLLTAPMIGLTITILISVLAPLTMAGFNPARDFGPRLFSALSGWGSLPFTTNGLAECLIVYVCGPLAGGLAGGGIYRLVLRPAYELLIDASDPGGNP